MYTDMKPFMNILRCVLRINKSFLKTMISFWHRKLKDFICLEDINMKSANQIEYKKLILIKGIINSEILTAQFILIKLSNHHF